ncbi:uncharacterized protein LOC144169408 isoform X3 [Haemaphysalis longicornis]
MTLIPCTDRSTTRRTDLDQGHYSKATGKIILSSADAGASSSSATASSQQHRDERSISDKKRRKKSVIGRFSRAVAKSFKTTDKNCSRHKDVELANEKLRQLNRGPTCYCTADPFRKSTRNPNAYTKRSAPTLGEQSHHHDLAGRLGEGMKTSSESSKDALRYHDVSPITTRHPHGISMVATGVRQRTYSEAKSSSQPDDVGSFNGHHMHGHHGESARATVAVLRQEVVESFAVIEAESPVPSSSLSTANLSESEDLASINTQPLQQSNGPAILECGQMQEIKLHKSAGGDDCSHQRSISKNTTMSDLSRTASVAAATSAEFCSQIVHQLKDASVQTEPPELDQKNSRIWDALRNFFTALRDCFLCAALAHKEAEASD